MSLSLSSLEQWRCYQAVQYSISQRIYCLSVGICFFLLCLCLCKCYCDYGRYSAMICYFYLCSFVLFIWRRFEALSLCVYLTLNMNLLHLFGGRRRKINPKFVLVQQNNNSFVQYRREAKKNHTQKIFKFRPTLCFSKAWTENSPDAFLFLS